MKTMLKAFLVRGKIFQEKKIFTFNGEGAKRNCAVSPPVMISLGALSMSQQKESYAEIGLCLSKLPKTQLFNKYLLSTCLVPGSVLDALYKLFRDLHNHPMIQSLWVAQVSPSTRRLR